MCGIWGFCGKKKLSNNELKGIVAKFKILGLYNITRGRDSCGIFANGEITKGVGTLKLFDDFIETTVVDTPKKNRVMIGHTRWATRGSHTEKNAHPFLINDRLVGAHNGTISNIEDLCNKYGLDSKQFNVDSEALYALIDQEGLGILNEYRGYAALCYTDLGDPDTLYLYHGASKTFKAGDVTEERPLYTMETSEGLYFSSLKESLEAIRDDYQQEPISLPTNIVFTITDGVITDKIVKVDRENNNIGINVNSTNCSVGNVHMASTKTNNFQSNTGKATTQTGKGGTSSNEATTNFPLVLKETLPSSVINHVKSLGPIVYYHRGRHFIYPRIKCHGEISILEKGYVVRDTDVNASSAKSYYFWDGVMLKDRQAYIALLELKADKNSFLNRENADNWASQLSKYSRFPVTNEFHQSKHLEPYFRFAWFMDSRRMNGSSTPKFSNGRSFSFENGILKRIIGEKEYTCVFKDFGTAQAELTSFIEKTDSKGGEGGSNAGNFPESPISGTSSSSSVTIIKPSEDHTINPYKKRPYFFEISFSEIGELVASLSPIEIKALRKYMRHFLDNTSPLYCSDKEVEMACMDLMKMATDNNVSIATSIGKKEDIDDLYRIYEETVDDAIETEKMNIQDLTDDSPVDAYVEALEETFNKDETSTDSDINDIIEDSIDSIESLQGSAYELTSNQESDFAQEIAKSIYISIDKLTNALEVTCLKYDKFELLNRLKALKQKTIMV